MNILGISAFYHESACCLLRDGTLVAAAEEERFSRIKHDPGLPVAAFRYCLDAGGLSITDVDCIAYYESPTKRLSRQAWAGNPRYAPPDLPWLDADRPIRAIREGLGYDGPIEICDHHTSHAASSFYYSGFPEAAILTVDAVGEWTTTSYGAGQNAKLHLFEEVTFPHSLGLLYSTITAYLGFRVNSGEYKVMGLAPYGAPRYLSQMRSLITSGEQGQYQLNQGYFDFIRGNRMYTDALCDLFGAPPRQPETELTSFHADVAKSLQVVLEEMLLEKVGYLHTRVPSPNLCMAGGVALNCVANSVILTQGPFKRLFIQPAAGDAGGCLGAAALAHVRYTEARHTCDSLTDVYLGPSYTSAQIAHLLAVLGISAHDFRGQEPALLEAVVERLIQGKVVAWFQGRMEFGPRALGARSILADPRLPDMRDRLNLLVKKREAFRPFAPSVLQEHLRDHFELDHASPFMLETCLVRSRLDLPAITHVDGSARPQTVDSKIAPRYAALIDAFYRRTGCPILVNTSFNIRDEPIVCDPNDAFMSMIRSGIDSLVIEDFVIDRAMLPESWPAMMQAPPKPPSEYEAATNVYTFI